MNQAKSSTTTTGSAAVRHLLVMAGLVCLAAVLFLVMDVRHRVAGYRAAGGTGITGLATLTHCEWHRTGSFCVGDFVSSDGRIRRNAIRVNGAAGILNWDETRDGRPLPAGTKVRAALADPAATEAWTRDGSPWLEFSALHVITLAPVVLLVLLGRRTVRGGPSGWWSRHRRTQLRRFRRERRRARAGNPMN